MFKMPRDGLDYRAFTLLKKATWLMILNHSSLGAERKKAQFLVVDLIALFIVKTQCDIYFK